MIDPQIEADKLREEAYKIIQVAFSVSGGYEIPNSQMLNRLVDCIINCTILEVAVMQKNAIEKMNDGR